MNIMKYVSAIVLFTAIMGAAADRAHAGNKLFVGGLSWSTTDDAVVIDLSVHRRLARDGSEFFIASVVQIYDESGDLVATIFSDPQAIRPVRPLGDRILIEPLSVPWDRNAGNYTGPAGVAVMVQVFDRRGRPVNNAGAEAFDVLEIR